MERPEYDLLLCWFVEIGVDDAAWDHSASKSRDRLLESDIATKFLAAVCHSACNIDPLSWGIGVQN